MARLDNGPKRPRVPSRLRASLLGLALLGLCAAALAAGLVPAPLRSAIIVRSAGYERTFGERQGDAQLVVLSGKSGTAADDGREMASVLSRLIGDNRIAGRKVRVQQLEHETTPATLQALKSSNAEIVYIAKGLESVVASIPAQENAVKRIIVCASGADVALGCTLGVELDGSKPQLVLNLKQASAAGLRFDPSLLRLARIVK